MPQQRQARLVQKEAEQLLTSLSSTGMLLDAVKEALSRAWQETSTSDGHRPPWSILPLIVCESISGNGSAAIPAAVAVLYFKAAADVFDDIEDADSSQSMAAKLGAAVATNVATALLFLGEKALARLESEDVSAAEAVHVIEKFNSFYINACAGQHADILMSGDTAVSEIQYLKMIELKTASQLECSCCVGAMLTQTSQELVEIYSVFGRNLGMTAQIANDIRGAIAGKDIIKRKITLPVIYALAETDGSTRNQLELAFRGGVGLNESQTWIQDLLLNTGAIQYAAFKMETYRQQALAALEDAKEKGACVERLNLFLE